MTPPLRSRTPLFLATAPLLGALALPACGPDSGTSGAGGDTTSSTGGATTGGSGGTSDTGGTTTSTTSTGGAGGVPDSPPPGNAIVLQDGSVLPLYPVTAAEPAPRAVAFQQAGSVVTALDEDALPLWEKDLGEGGLFGGFDFDADGFPDLGLVRSQDTGAPCGAQTMIDTWLDVASGATGDLHALVPAEPAICWNFSGTIYPTTQWSNLGVLFGKGTSALATSPYYATKGAFWSWNGTSFDQTGTFEYPSTAAYDATYTNDQPNAYGQGQSFVQYSHTANGLFTEVSGEPRLVFFTSSRAVEYAVEPESASQLRADIPYLTGGRTDIAGRNYGLVEPDPGAPDHLALVAGTSADTVYSDMVTGAMTSDPWGQIERHVSIVHLAAGTVEDRFFSYAHDNADGDQYEGRVVYPNSPFVRVPGGPSRLAFNVYEGGHWRLHVTVPGGTADAVVLDDLFLWDIRDLEGDGLDDWVLSPSRDPSDPDVPGYYFVKWRTVLARWTEATLSLHSQLPIEGAIPWLAPTFRLPGKTTSRSSLYPALVARLGPVLELLLRGPDGQLMSYTLGPVP